MSAATRQRGDAEINWLVVITVALLALVAVGVYFGVMADRQFKAGCQGLGGHTKTTSKTVTTTGINPSNGQPVTSTGVQSTTFCLSDDGRILDIQ
jgi:hypothetical protein